MSEQIRMLLDLSDVPGGESQGFSTKALRMFQALAREARDLRELVGQGDDESTQGPIPRVPHFYSSSNPYTISSDPEVHAIGTLFDDVGASATSTLVLPSSQDLGARYDLESEIPYYYVARTSASRLTVQASGSDDILTGAQAAAGAGATEIDIPIDHCVKLGLVDNRWRILHRWAQGRIGTRVVRSGAKSIATGTEVFVDFDTEPHDYHGFWDSGSPTLLVVPPGYAGLYIATAQVQWEAALGGPCSAIIQHLDSGGSVLSYAGFRCTAAVTATEFSASYVFLAAEGEKFRLRVEQGSGSNKNLNAGASMSIARVSD